MGKGHHCFEILMERKLPSDLPTVVFVYGDDGFLRRETAAAILQMSGIEVDVVRSFDGEECEWLDVHDELATLSLFDTSATRVAMVTAGEKLVKEARGALERWCESPAAGSLLIVQLASFPSNTKLFKIASQTGWCIDCNLPTTGPRSKTPSIPELKKWLREWATARHGLHLTTQQCNLIVDAVGLDCGLLHQELAKLALYADGDGKLTDKQTREHVGSWRTRTMWEIADSIVDGRTTDALAQLDRVFAAGEHPAAVVPQIAWSLRRFGNAAQLILQGKRTGAPISAKAAVSQCGFWGRDVQLAEQRLRRLGLRRASKLLDWLLELDLKIKGSHSHPSCARFALEELCFRLHQ